MPLQIPWVIEQAARIRAHPTAWEGYQRAGIIEPDQVQRLRAAERSHDSVAAEAGQYAELYTKLLGKISRIDTQQVVLVLFTDLVQVAGRTVLDGAIAPLRKLLTADDLFVQVTAAQLIVISVSSVPESNENKEAVNDTIPVLTGLSGKRGGDAALLILAELLRAGWVRSFVWETDVESQRVVPALLSVLRKQDKEVSPADRIQLQYLALLVLWILTFHKDAARGLDVHFGAASVLVAAARGVLKEKILRMVIAIFVNMLHQSDENAKRLLGAGALPLCETLNERRYADPDVEQGLQFVLRTLYERLKLMSSYDQYVAELESGHLSFESPTHTLEDFWRENAERLTQNQGRDLAKLVRLLGPSTPDDPTTYAVACSDVSFFLRFFEVGRQCVFANQPP